MEKQSTKRSLKDFQDSQLSITEQKATKGGWLMNFLKALLMPLSSDCCGNDNGVW